MDQKAINSIRSLALDMIDEAKSGYPGVTLDAAPTFYTLYAKHMSFNKINPTWINRDRFVLSAGHAGALLYSTLFYSGYSISLDQIKNYSKISSPLECYPTLNNEIGVDATTGFFGEGVATGVGMAISEEYLRNVLSSDIINHYTYVFASDGDLMEGITYEAASLAGSLGLGHLIMLYDSNLVMSDSKIKGVFDDNIKLRFESINWDVHVVENGEDYNQIDKAIKYAKGVSDKPSLIIVKSLIGLGSFLEGTSEVCDKPLKLEDLLNIKDKMNISRVPFHTSKEAYDFITNSISGRNINKYNDWIKKRDKLCSSDERIAKIVKELEHGLTPINLKSIKINFDSALEEDMRKTNQNLMNAIFKVNDLFILGSSNSNKFTKAYLELFGDFSVDNRGGRNIQYGTRENAMGAIMNGMALCGLRPVGSTRLSFSNYIRPSIKYSALMKKPVTYVFTDDGVSDNCVEEVSILRCTPNLNVYKPADVRELVACWDNIINLNKPSALIIPSEEKPLFMYSNILEASKGGYIIKHENGRLGGIIISSGSDVESSIMVSDILDEKGIHTRVISMPSVEVFEDQDEEYKNSLFQIGTKIIAIESSNDPIWNKYVYNDKFIINIDHYSKRGTKDEVIKLYDFDIDSLVARVEKLLK